MDAEELIERVVDGESPAMVLNEARRTDKDDTAKMKSIAPATRKKVKELVSALKSKGYTVSVVHGQMGPIYSVKKDKKEVGIVSHPSHFGMRDMNDKEVLDKITKQVKKFK